MRWPHPILTDSGGFQVMSLANLRKVEEQGVTFRSHLDGAMIELTPERAIEVQILLGSDIAMQLDECVRLPAERSEIERAMQSVAALGRALQARVREGGRQARRCSASCRAATIRICARRARARWPTIGFDGYAIGGLAVGEPQDVMLKVVGETAPMLPADKPRYLMGVGTPADILEAVARGIDMFDCVMPTRNGRHGLAFTRFGPINIKNAHHADDPRPLDAESRCPAARDFSRAYLHHLFRSRRGARRHAVVDRQSLLLPGRDGGRARGHRGRALCRLSRAYPRTMGREGRPAGIVTNACPGGRNVAAFERAPGGECRYTVASQNRTFKKDLHV